MRQIANLPKDNTARQYTFWEWLTADLPAFSGTYALPLLKGVSEQILYLPLITGAVTINLSNTNKGNLVAGDKVIIIAPCDGTSRTITWGTNIKAGVAATLVLQINGKAAVMGVFDGTDLVLNNG